ncbi:hypothetical protein O6P37_25965 [Mycobacterium sp. CPCC 205372]|jgi:hypothetical protein|uniref:Uncharacterized protein n=1 Tax=Mycobacterium hippophais TaxID=3016340 RepID=A0ABT4Q0F3_9MYCO|nr:hypothetical protein [Mycobacterium hippophais]MCZ8382322.1 hypothetical protein [Mycobacterium hippophais]
MRTHRKRSQAEAAEREMTKRRNPRSRRGVPPLSLWEVGIGAVWK